MLLRGLLPHRTQRQQQVRSIVLVFKCIAGQVTDCVCIAAAAAKINAQLQAKKGIQHVDVPPIRSVSSILPIFQRHV